MLKFTQQQKTLQRLSPQQIKLMQLLELPGLYLDEKIKEEIDDNPALEYDSENSDEDEKQKDADDSTDDESVAEEQYDQSDVEDFLPEDEDFREGIETSHQQAAGDSNYVEAGEYSPSDTSLQEYLITQAAMLKLSEGQQKIAEQIIGSLDDDGYLRRPIISIVDDLSFGQSLFVEEDEVEEVLGLIRNFDPPGIAATDLQDCLMLQVGRLPLDTPLLEEAEKVIGKYFNEISNKQYEKIMGHLKISEVEMREIVKLITHLNPRPGANFMNINKAETYIVPDFLVYSNGNRLEVSLTSTNMPKLRLAEGFQEMLSEYSVSASKAAKSSKEATSFLKSKLDNAQWFITAMEQRKITLLTTMRAIVKMQEDFFQTGDWATLRPMVLRSIAEKTAYDISTISRVSNSKYVQTEFGVFKLKALFSEGLQTEDGEELSVHEIKSALVKLVEEEDKKNPLPDDALMERLKKQGYPIARRTIAKYREQLSIPVARLRKEL